MAENFKEFLTERNKYTVKDLDDETIEVLVSDRPGGGKKISIKVAGENQSMRLDLSKDEFKKFKSGLK